MLVLFDGGEIEREKGDSERVSVGGEKKGPVDLKKESGHANRRLRLGYEFHHFRQHFIDSKLELHFTLKLTG